MKETLVVDGIIGDVGVIIYHYYKDPYINQPEKWKVRGCFSWLIHPTFCSKKISIGLISDPFDLEWWCICFKGRSFSWQIIGSPLYALSPFTFVGVLDVTH